MNKRYKAKITKKMRLQKILIYIIIAILVIIAIGTVFGLLNKKNTKNEVIEKESPASIRGDKGLYSDLGRLRAISADNPPCPIVIFPILEYDSNDKDFEEELVQKKEELRQIILAWFANYKKHEIYSMPELEIKKSLLYSMNSILSLSKIKKIYFKEFVILE